jgi:kinesin family member C1
MLIFCIPVLLLDFCSARRVQSARDNGQLLVFSPNGSNVVFPPNHRDMFLHQENVDNIQRPTPTKKKSSKTTPERTNSRRQSSSPAAPAPPPPSPPPPSSTKKKLEARCQELLEQSRVLHETNVQVRQQKEQLQMDLDHAHEELLTQTANHQQDTSQLKSQLAGMQQQVEIRIQGLELVRSKLEQQVAQLQSDKVDLVRQTVELQRRAAQLEHELQQNQDAIATMNRNSESEKEELAGRSIVEFHCAINHSFHSSFNHCANLKIVHVFFFSVVSLERLEQENATLQQEMDVVATTQTAMQTKITEYEQLIDTLQRHVLPEKELQLEKSLLALRNSEQVVLELESTISTYTQLVQELRDEIQRITNEKSTEKDDLSNALNNVNQENARLQAQVSEKQVAMQALVQQRDLVQRQLDEAQNSATTARDECNHRCTEMSNRIDELNAALETTMQDLDASERSVRDIQQQLDQTQDRLQQALREKDGATLEQSQTSAALSDLQGQLAQACDRITGLERERDSATKARAALEHNLSYATNECQVLERQRDAALQHVAGFDAREAELTRRLQLSDMQRRDLHASVMTLMGNIRVFVRVRPLLASEQQAAVEQQQQQLAPSAIMKKRTARELEHANQGTDGLFRFPGLYDREDKAAKTGSSNSNSTAVARATSSEDILKNIVEVTEPWKDRGGLSERRITHRFGFDNVFAPSHTQQDVWEATEPLVQSAIDGFNVCIFAYGQTGSGKTYTMLGGGGSSESSLNTVEEQGVIIRSVRKLFQAKQEMQELSKGETQVAVSVELIEIYNEQVHDLLATGGGSISSDKIGDRRKSLKVNSQQVVGNKVISTATQEDVMRVLTLAQKRRCTKATSSNAESSRSHMLFTIHFEVTNGKTGMKRAGKLHVCDLAGSERLSKSGAHYVGGSLLEETKHINQSLSVLSNVIEKLQAGAGNEGKQPIPFRESQLTYILQNSLGGNSKTLAIVCCSPLPCNYHETLCSLRFAEKVNKVSLKKACANLSSSNST